MILLFYRTLFLILLFLVLPGVIQAKIYKTLHFKGSGVDTLLGELSTEKLYSVIGKPFPPFYAFWRSDPTFESRDIEEYESKLHDYYESLGYFKASISHKIGQDEITIYIQKNNPILVNSIKIAPDTQYEKLIAFKKGAIFRTDTFKSTKETLMRHMMENAHPKYAFDAKAYVHLDTYQVDLDYHVDENSSCVIGDSNISGQGDVKKEIIQDAITYKKGDKFDIRKLEKTYDKIYEYGIYDYIAVAPKLDSNGTQIPIEIALKTGETKFFKSNIGYSTDLGARGGISWTDKNFFGNLKVLDVSFQINKIGYEFANTYYDPRIMIPYFGKITLKDEFKYYMNDYDSYQENVWENRFTLGKIFIGLEHYFGLLTEVSKIEPKIAGFEDEAGNYFINSLFYRVLIDERDSMIDARKGYYISLYLEKSTKYLASELDYLKALLEMRYIKSLGDKTVLGVKTRLGSINEDVPIFKRFYTGGSVTNRGYAYQDVGVKDPDGLPLGGVSLVDFLIEVRHQMLFDNFWLTVFYDTSMLSLKPQDFTDTFYNSLGMGIRYLTAIGPLRVDFGFPQDEGGFEFHISIGQVF